MPSPTVPLSGGSGDSDPSGSDRPAAGSSARTVPLRPGPRGPGSSLEDQGTPGDPDRAEERIGRVLGGRYELRRLLGRGGMGLVYEALHITVGRSVAIKLLRHDLARSREAVNRFMREARAAAAIGNEHIVEVFDFSYTEEGEAFIVMELLEGENLGARIRREGPLPLSQAIAIAKQVAQALDVAHAKGIIHRDLKSENVFLVSRNGGDFVKLLDFGISKVLEGDEGRGTLTREGVLMGTPHYMAPELVQGDVQLDRRVDVYALGCLLYEMITGRVPFTGKHVVEVLYKHVHESPEPPSRLRSDVPSALESVVLRALEKDRERRFATAAEVLEALTALGDVTDGAVTSAPDAAVQSSGSLGDVSGAKDERRSQRSMVLTMVAAGVLVITGMGVWLHRPASPRQEQPSQKMGSPTHWTSQVSRRLDAGSAVRQEDATVPAPTEKTEEVLVEITVRPRSALIAIDGEELGTGAVRVRYPRGSRHRIVFRAVGYVPREDDLLVDGPVSRVYSLARLSTGAVTVREETDAAVLPSRTVNDAGQGASDLPQERRQHSLDPAEGLKGSPYGGRGLP